MRLRLGNARSGMDVMTPSIALVAPAFWFAWYSLLYSGKVRLSGFLSQPSDIMHAFLISTTALCLTLVLIGALNKRLQPALDKPLVVVGAGMGASLATLLELFTGSFVAIALTGVFTALLASRFGTLYAQVNPKATMVALLISQLVGSCVSGYVFSIPDFWQPVLMCLLPLLGGACSLIDGGSLRYGSADTNEPVSADFLRLVAALFLLTALIYVTRSFYPSASDSDMLADALGAKSQVLVFFVRMGILALVLLLPVSTNLPKLCYYLFLALAFVALPLPFASADGDVASGFFALFNTLKNLFMWTLLAGVAYKTGRSPLRLFNWGYAGMAMGSNVGILLGLWLRTDAGVGGLAPLTEVILLTTLLVCCTIIVNARVLGRLFTPVDGDQAEVGLGSEQLTRGLDPTAPQAAADRISATSSRSSASTSPSSSDHQSSGAIPLVSVAGDDDGPRQGRWRKAVSQMAVDCDLSPREADVLALLLKGHNKKHVSEELCVSYNTVRSHVRNIYSKCDAHSQQDLIDILDLYLLPSEQE